MPKQARFSIFDPKLKVRCVLKLSWQGNFSHNVSIYILALLDAKKNQKLPKIAIKVPKEVKILVFELESKVRGVLKLSWQGNFSHELSFSILAL